MGKVKFIVTRTSSWGDEVEPCAGAVRGTFVRVDTRSVDDPKKIPANRGTDGGWYSEGRNHRIEDGNIKRDFDDETWFIEVASLDELVAFSRTHGNLVIGEAWNSNEFLRLEIYDGYRE